MVIKFLGYYFKNIRGIVGVMVRGDGKIIFIVDVGVMMDMVKSIKVNIIILMNEFENMKSKNFFSDYIVLVIDDSSMDRVIICKCLKLLGIMFLEVINGLEGLEMFKNGDKILDVILVDIEMFKMDGYIFVFEVCKYNKFKNLFLIVVISWVIKIDRMCGVEFGMIEYIIKFYSGEYLIIVVKRSIKLEGD